MSNRAPDLGELVVAPHPFGGMVPAVVVALHSAPTQREAHVQTPDHRQRWAVPVDALEIPERRARARAS